MFVLPCAITTLLSLYLSSLCFGHVVRTRSRPCDLCHRPYTLAHIKGFGSLVCMSMLACFYTLSSMLAFLVLGFAMLNALRRHLRDAGCFLHTSPFSALCDNMLTMLVCATHWLSMHLYILAYMFMHESCMLVCLSHFNTMKSWTFDPNLHLSLADTPFCVFSLLVCLHCLLVSFLAFVTCCVFIYAFSFHCLSASFLFFAFACTHMER